MTLIFFFSKLFEKKWGTIASIFIVYVLFFSCFLIRLFTWKLLGPFQNHDLNKKVGQILKLINSIFLTNAYFSLFKIS